MVVVVMMLIVRLQYKNLVIPLTLFLQYGVLTGGVISRNTTTIDGIYTHLKSIYGLGIFLESEWYFEKNGYYYLITNYLA